ncbi:hypothetical protein MRB53_033078 [Persea americana]|uniref:Uncharacterized protein n=1 Tax=Persea americana TaxID=3435 RepID=A0ACC2KU95_PERAE|nr:hypothetical protein MRB53_033078 [Persea americana]
MAAETMDPCRVLIHHASTAGRQVNDLVVTTLQVEESFGVAGNENKKKRFLIFFHKLREVRSKKISKSSARIHERETLSDLRRCLQSLLQEKNQRHNERRGKAWKTAGSARLWKKWRQEKI